jgi:cytochrome oxidase Cu insertion factor (SCO1/SenC/PrrC family)
VKNLNPILETYGQRVDRKKNPDDPLGPLSHLVRVYLIDRDKMIRNIYSFGLLDPRLLLADVRTLLLEEKRALSE